MRVWTTNWPPLFVLCVKFCCNSANYQTAGFVKKCTAVICTLMLLCHFKKNCEHIHGVHTLDLRVSEEHVYLRICNLECSIWCLYLWDTHFTPVRAVGCWVGHLNKEEQHFKLPCACVYYFLLVLERKKKSGKKIPFLVPSYWCEIMNQRGRVWGFWCRVTIIPVADDNGSLLLASRPK